MENYKLNIGCGGDYKEGYINIDNNPNYKTDILKDISEALKEIEPNSNITLSVYCDYYKKFDYNDRSSIDIQFSWLYPMCAMLETNSEFELYNYDIKFKEYNLCFYLTNNKTVGACN